MQNSTKILLGIGLVAVVGLFFFKKKPPVVAVPSGGSGDTVHSGVDPKVLNTLDVFIPPIPNPKPYTPSVPTAAEIEAALINAAQTTPETASGGHEKANTY